MSIVKENLKKAMKIVKHHWVKGTLDNGSGRYCAIGAIEHVATGPTHLELYALSNALPSGYISVMAYNDKIATHADIMSLFRRAIRACK